jgi:hypothetical protein
MSAHGWIMFAIRAVTLVLVLVAAARRNWGREP